MNSKKPLTLALCVCFILIALTAAQSQATVYEAEDAVYFGLTLYSASNASGGYCLASFDNVGDYIRYDDVVESDLIYITYFTKTTASRCSIYVNGTDVATATFPAGSVFEFATIGFNVTIPAGAELKLQIDSDDRTFNNNSYCVVQDKIELTSSNGFTIVNTIEELRSYMDQNDVNIKMTPGTYVVNDFVSNVAGDVAIFKMTGSNCYYDFTDATIQIPTTLLQQMNSSEAHGRTSYIVSGSNITIDGGTFENTYPQSFYYNYGDELNGDEFVSYNETPEYYPSRSMHEFSILGDNVIMKNSTVIIRGSYPYGYGDIFGKGAVSSVYLRKHSGIKLGGQDCVLKDCYVKSEAFGHGIFMQGTINALIEGCHVEGAMRSTDDMLAETSGVAYDLDFMSIWGWEIPAGYTFCLSEDGIRCYNEGDTSEGTRNTETTTVKNCKVVNMRGGVTIGFSNGTNLVSGCTVIGGESGFWPGNGDTVINCQGEAAYARLINNPYSNDNNQNISLTVLRETDVYGNEQLAYIAGDGHNITLNNSSIQPRPYAQTIQMAGLKLGARYIELVEGRNDYPLSNTTLTNWTDQPVVLDVNSSNCDVDSYGTITDYGSGNSTSSISPVTITASANTGSAYNTVDANTATYWSGDNSEWIQYDLGQTRNFNEIEIKWLNGSATKNFFEIQTSSASTGPWTTAFAGTSQGITDEFEEYDFPAVNARYVRVVSSGSSAGNTVDIVELDVDLKDRFAMVKTKSDDGNVAQNTRDASLATRWSAQGDGQWIQYDLLEEKTVNAVSIAWYNGNTRTSDFDIAVSTHSMGPWTTVYTGTSSGTTLELEEYKFTPTTAQYIRITGYGNSENDWNSITETFINTGNVYCGDLNTYLSGDLNRDCIVNFKDVALLASEWLK